MPTQPLCANRFPSVPPAWQLAWMLSSPLALACGSDATPGAVGGAGTAGVAGVAGTGLGSGASAGAAVSSSGSATGGSTGSAGSGGSAGSAGSPEPGVARPDSSYYIDPTGDDANDGKQPTSAWRTIERANQHAFQPGESLLLAGGKSFVGNLVLDAQDAGTAADPVIVGSFGNGSATIRAGLGSCVVVENAGGVEIENLICVGDDRTKSQGSGVAFVNSLPGNTRLSHVRVRGVEASGFGRALPGPQDFLGFQPPHGAGIFVGGVPADGSKSGFDDVAVSRSVAHDNAYYGILITGYWSQSSTSYANRHVRIADCLVYDNTGDPLFKDNHSGSGILLEDVDDGVVERCVAHDNGAQCFSSAGGPAGIWTAGSNKVTIQDCESYRNHSGSLIDGDGFDLDGGSTNCVLQYNYSHHNDGAGILLYTYGGAPFEHRDNVVRYNVTENDAVKAPQYGAIFVRNDGSGISGLQIYNNTIISNLTSAAAVNVDGNGASVSFWNNVILTKPGAAFVNLSNDRDAVVFQGNLYWSGGADFSITGDTRFTSIQAWRERGKERLQGAPVGGFASPALNLDAARGTDGDLSRLATLLAFSRGPEGAAVDDAVDIESVYKVDPGPRDFAGHKTPQGSARDVGALERQP